MNDLDREIRRAFDELVAAAPPPPSGPGVALQPASGNGGSGRRVLAIAASFVVIAVAGAVLLAQRDSADDTLVTTDEPAPSAVDTTSPVVRSTPSTAPPTTADDIVDSTAAPTTVEPVAGVYEIVTGQRMPGTTAPIPESGEAFDGIYFAYLHEGAPPEDPSQLRFDVLQAFTGADCAARFGAEAPSVCTPIGVDIAGSTTRLDLAVTEVPVSVRDLDSDASYLIPGEELIALVFGETPAASAPEGFGFSGGFGFLLTYDAGTLIRIDQPAFP